MKHISARSRLFVSFITLLVWVVIASALAWNSMNALKSRADTVVKENTTMIGKLEQSRQALQRSIPASQAQGLAEIAESIASNEKKLRESTSSLNEQYDSATTKLLGTLILAIASGIALAWFTMTAFSGPLAQATEIARAIAKGKLDNPIDETGSGEPGDLLKSLAAMQDALADRAESNRIASAENQRVRNALDNASSGTMISDPDGKIVYINKAQIEMFRKGEADLRKSFASFDANNLLGKSMDLFHKNPAHQRNLLANLTKPHKVTVRIGELTYVIEATPVFDANGQRLGIAAGWVDRTAELAAESEVASIVKAASQGDFSKRITEAGKEGFYKQLAENMNNLVNTCEVGLNDVSRVLGALANGDLTARITNDYQGAFGKLKQDCSKTVDYLTEIVGQIREASETIDTASREIAQGNGDLSQRTEAQASSLEETASSMEELTSTVKQNADNARQANQLAVGASDVATKGGAVVKRVVETMGGISESSKKIADIIGTIDGIAFQTNILALNAAVEAARAGEQGRGFAVVAAEVRNLAQRSAEAAKEIKALITDSVERVDSGTELVNEAGNTMDEIVNSITRVTAIMAEITAASQEQTSGIEQVNQAITQMDEVTQQNAALVEQAASAAESMQEQSGQLVQTMSVFRVGSAVNRPARSTGPTRRAA